MKIFLTGGSGFIGKEFRRLARNNGHEIFAAGREWVTPDIFENFTGWSQYDALIHLAAAGVKHDESRNWRECMEVNFHATRRLLESVLRSCATPIVYIAGTIRQTETMDRPELWGDPYVVSKILAEHYILEWAMRYKGRLIYPMLAPCYGPGEVQAVAAKILEAIS